MIDFSNQSNNMNTHQFSLLFVLVLFKSQVILLVLSKSQGIWSVEGNGLFFLNPKGFDFSHYYLITEEISFYFSWDLIVYSLTTNLENHLTYHWRENLKGNLKKYLTNNWENNLIYNLLDAIASVMASETADVKNGTLILDNVP